jgi:hypothetical protein
MPGLRDFLSQSYNFRTVVTKAANYTVTLSDEWVKVNGTYTMTLPVISTMKGTLTSKKSFKFSNVGTTTKATITAGTGNTIGGRASIVLHPGESIIIEANEAATSWDICSPTPLAPGIRNIVTLIATTSGTTAQNVIDASGCPVVGEIVDIVTEAQDTLAGNIIIKNANGTIATVAKSTTEGLLVAATTLTTPSMAVGDLLTVESSTTNGNARVRIYLSTQTLTSNG